MWVSHETIYQSLFVQGRGCAASSTAVCAQGELTDVHGVASNNSGQIPDMVMISERPAEVEDRAVPGHWEGDLIIGKNGLRGRHARGAIHPLRDAVAPARRTGG